MAKSDSVWTLDRETMRSGFFSMVTLPLAASTVTGKPAPVSAVAVWLVAGAGLAVVPVWPQPARSSVPSSAPARALRTGLTRESFHTVGTERPAISDGSPFSTRDDDVTQWQATWL